MSSNNNHRKTMNLCSAWSGLLTFLSILLVIFLQRPDRQMSLMDPFSMFNNMVSDWLSVMVYTEVLSEHHCATHWGYCVQTGAYYKEGGYGCLPTEIKC